MTFNLQQDMNNRLVGPSRKSCSQSWQWETKLQRLDVQRDPGGSGTLFHWVPEVMVLRSAGYSGTLSPSETLLCCSAHWALAMTSPLARCLSWPRWTPPTQAGVCRENSLFHEG